MSDRIAELARQCFVRIAGMEGVYESGIEDAIRQAIREFAEQAAVKCEGVSAHSGELQRSPYYVRADCATAVRKLAEEWT